jgi:hypothetical protein
MSVFAQRVSAANKPYKTGQGTGQDRTQHEERRQAERRGGRAYCGIISGFELCLFLF